MRFSTLEKKAKLVKTKFQKISKFVSSQITLSETQTLNTTSIQRLHNYDDEVRGLFSDFKALFDKVVYDDPGSDYDENEACSMQDEVSDLYISVISDLKTVLPTKTEVVTPPTQPSLRLPKFELPKFSGNYEEWVSFYNIFEASVNKNETLAPVTKFQYLLSSLSGEPLDLVKSLSITAENFDVALRLLKDRYDNKRRVVTQLVTKIIDLPCIISGSLKSLQHFLTVYKENTQVLKNLSHDITTENTLLVLTLLKKLPTDLRKSFEDSRTTNNDIPAVNDLIRFLEREFKRLEGASIGLGPSANTRYSSVQKAQPNNYRPKPHRDSKPYSPQPKAAFVTVTNTCKFCQASDHNIYKCQAFQAKSRGDRVEFTRKNNLCSNCLGHLHDTNNCPSRRGCQICSKRHHTLLHDSNPTQQEPGYPTKVFENKSGKPPTQNLPPNQSTAPMNKSALVGLSSQLNPTKTTILLGTCLVQVFSKDGQQTVLRAVLDSAAQLTLISERAVQLISASRTRVHDEIQGISGSLINPRGIVHIDISAINGQPLAYHHPCMVLSRITTPLPQIPVSPQVKESLNDFVLADPCFDKPGDIDLLIGADLFALTLTGEQHFLGHNLPQVLGTIFGFVVMGVAPVATYELSISQPVSFLTTHDGDLHSSLQRFWSIEEPPTCVKTQSEEDVLCLQYFEKTHTRDNSGRYVVELPKRPNHPPLGESSNTAQLRLKSMERKFTAQPEFKAFYSEFMDDYIKSGHMSVCEQPPSGECYCLPHHGVFRENPPNSKIRVVFDGSAKTNNGVSLNDILMPGPKLQNDISDVLLYFRCHKIVFTCDIRQMYRQILVTEDDKKYQLIFWRSNPDQPLQVLKLNTVTYGLNCSPFIAIKTLQQLVNDEGHSYPKASEILSKSIFYDDIIAGAESLDEALSAQNELKDLLSRGGFELRKWISNAPQLLDQVPIEHKETPVELTENSEAFFSVLGLKWTPETDMLSYKVKDVEISATLTKRRILSAIAKLYDLPGFLTPVIFWAKTLIQYLWTTGLTWDEPVPNDIRTKWHSFLEELPIIQDLRIPRYVSTSLHTSVELHGFSDASEKGYAAVVYLRVTDSQGDTRIYLIISKSKVAPLKRISLPRLELCGAHLLGKLLQYCLNILSARMKIESIYAWCDSTIVLTWIRTLPYRLKVFIANRISELQELVPPHSWNYFKSQDNPADCATRGLSPSQLVTHHLWWNGPEWWQLSSDSWPKPKFTPVTDDDTLEIKPNPLNVLATTEKTEHIDFDLLERYSCFRKLVNVMAYILRFIHNLRANDPRIGQLTCQETSAAKLRIFKLIQSTSFKDDISALKKVKLARLSPYFDDNGIVRVGGRLKHSNLTQDAKHPVLLPKSHCAVKLLIMHYHLKYLHVGPQLLQSILSQEVWILSARSVIRSVIFKCQRCFRLRPVNKPPLMGDLPETRLKPVRPFYHTGMDYSGHFDVKVHSTRNALRLKSYLCLFICFATKAVHLEIVTDLSVDSFIAALKRFVSRRGLCAHLYSDCGTNYVGASKQLMKTFQNFINESNTKDALNSFALDHSINFHFQPPAVPHQGGLWESAIKSSKYHLKRVIGDRVLTLMELMTLVTQVEAVLNSRPLTALSADPSDITALTPGHFLIGTSLVAVPEPNLEEVPENRLNHWQTVQALHQRFWRRWHQEYLHQLQQRKKWEKPNKNLEVGDLVIIQDLRTPPLLWPLGRIVKTSPGSDGIVRVVTIKTQRGTFCRPATKVYPLP